MTRIASLALMVLASSALAQGIRIEKGSPVAVAEPAKTGYLGVRVAPVNAESRQQFKIPAEITQGVVLVECTEDGPALRAGLRAGDVITKFAGQAVKSPEDLIAAVRKHAPGARVTYVLRRGTGTIAGSLTLGERKPQAAAPTFVPVTPPPAEKNLDQRLDQVQTDIEKLRKRLLETRRRAAPSARPPTSLEGWLEREEIAMVAARKAGETDKVRFHAARMALLREMKRAGAEFPAQRLNRIERKVTAILKVLEELEDDLEGDDDDDDDEDEEDDD